MSVVDIQGLHKVYRSGSIEVHALRGIDLEIRKSEFTVIAGPSGSGKSTLLNLIGALDVPTKGSVKIGNRDLSTLSPKQLSKLRRDHIGFVFQAYNLIPVLTGVENVEFILMIQGEDAKKRRERAQAILRRVGLKEQMDRRPIDMSGGQQQRVAVARAIVSDPLIVLADEPTANLDSKTGEGLLKIMKQMNKNKKVTFIFSTHDKMVMDYADRVVYLKDGRILKD